MCTSVAYGGGRRDKPTQSARKVVGALSPGDWYPNFHQTPLYADPLDGARDFRSTCKSAPSLEQKARAVHVGACDGGRGAGQLPPRVHSAETNAHMEASSRWRRVPGPRPGHGPRTRSQTEQEFWERRGPRGRRTCDPDAHAPAPFPRDAPPSSSPATLSLKGQVPRCWYYTEPAL